MDFELNGYSGKKIFAKTLRIYMIFLIRNFTWSVIFFKKMKLEIINRRERD